MTDSPDSKDEDQKDSIKININFTENDSNEYSPELMREFLLADTSLGQDSGAIGIPTWYRDVSSIGSSGPIILSKSHSFLPNSPLKINKLDEDIFELKKKIINQANELEELKADKGQQQKTIDDLNENVSSLKAKEKLRHLLDRVGESARKALLDGEQLKELFEKHETCNAYVLSIDLRRSTELMLKARSPRLFAEFITKLAIELKAVILRSYGIFDKFTGDGILAYFPEFFSGKKAGLVAVESAEICHKLFRDHYHRSRRCFFSVLQDTGLGIGLDYGQVSMVQMQGELTVVGTPVVYACRLSSAHAGQTLINQPAYEQLLEGFSDYIDFSETSINVKHEGDMLAYSVSRNEKPVEQICPQWHVPNETE